MTEDSSKHDANLGEVDIPRADALLQGKLSLGIETPIDFKRSAVNIHSVALSVSKWDPNIIDLEIVTSHQQL